MSPRLKRDPHVGWIYPSIDDQIIIFCREGDGLLQIADRLRINDVRVRDIILRAVAYGLLTDEEALASYAMEPRND
jgi:hypothetical protein